MKIIEKNTGNTVATILTNRGMTLDQAIALLGHYDNDRAQSLDADTEINGEWYFYDDLDTVADDYNPDDDDDSDDDEEEA